MATVKLLTIYIARQNAAMVSVSHRFTARLSMSELDTLVKDAEKSKRGTYSHHRVEVAR